MQLYCSVLFHEAKDKFLRLCKSCGSSSCESDLKLHADKTRHENKREDKDIQLRFDKEDNMIYFFDYSVVDKLLIDVCIASRQQ